MKILSLINKQKYLIFSLLIAIWAGLALLHPGLPPTHDGEYHVIRFYEFDKVLRNGTLYPRWAPDLNFGYGVPLFTYVYPLPNYAASFFHLFGTSFIDAFKLQMFAAILIGGIFFYLFAKEYFGEKGGLIGSAFYSFAPYHFVDIYIRGSVGEVWALGLFPLFLWSYTKFIRTQNVSYFFYSIATLSLIIFAHNIMALMFFCFIITYVLFHIAQSKKKLSVIRDSFFIIFLSLGITAVFWLPALLQTSYVEGLQIYNLQKNFPDLFQLLFPSWGTGFFDENLVNQMSVQIGTANLLAVLLSAIYFVKQLRQPNPNKMIIGFFLVAFCITFFFLTPYSSFLWKILPLFHYFQFPWRLLSLMILICAFLAASFFHQSRSVLWVAVFLTVLFITTYDYAHPAFYHLRNDAYYTSRSNFIDGTNSPGNVFHTMWTPVFLERPKQQATIIKGKGDIILKKKTPTSQFYSVTLHSPSDIVFATGYFPEWTAKVNNTFTKIKTENGLISISLPKGSFSVILTAATTPLETAAAYLSCISIAISISFLIVRKWHKIL